MERYLRTVKYTAAFNQLFLLGIECICNLSTYFICSLWQPTDYSKIAYIKSRL